MTATVLIIDEDESVTRSLVRLLSVHGLDAHGETSSANALATAVAIQPTVFLIDLHLSQRSGIEIARQIRAEKELTGARLIGMSATVPDWDPDALAVFDSMLAKPIPSEILLAAIRG